MQTLIIHGRQPEIARAELESLHGPKRLRPAGGKATLLDMDPQEIDFMRLGGMVKFCKVLTVLDTVDWQDIEKFLVQAVPAHFTALPGGKLKIGLSVYGIKAEAKQIHATGIEIKKVGKRVGRSIRVVPNKSSELNAAQVLHNKLTQKLGWELVFVRDGNKTLVAQSIAVQDIDAYARRDHGRPCRDAKVGMLPPKLAQTIVNLAAADKKPDDKTTVLDPFCGSGVALQEAVMTGFGVYATDNDRRMVDCASRNLMWLLGQPRCPVKRPNDTLGDCNWKYFKSETADATTYKWKAGFDIIASETYLGRPLAALPSSNELDKIIKECEDIHEKFLRNLAKQIKPGFRLCLAVPAWKSGQGFRHLKTLAKLQELGYNSIKFEHADGEELVYHRPGQVVARELIILIRK